MSTPQSTKVTIQAVVNAPVSTVWNSWNLPEHITKWNSAIDTWHCPYAENDLRVGGQIKSRMEAKDGSMGFDFGGVYTEVVHHQRISYKLGDEREVNITFKDLGNTTEIIETFDAENQNPIELQRNGWQSILNNFKKYTEAL